MSAETAIAITAKLSEARDTLRKLFKDDFVSRVKPWKQPIYDLMGREGIQMLSAALRLAEAAEDPREKLWLMAAAVEIIDPTKKQQ